MRKEEQLIRKNPPPLFQFWKGGVLKTNKRVRELIMILDNLNLYNNGSNSNPNSEYQQQ